MWVYIEDSGRYLAGYYPPVGKFFVDSKHKNKKEARAAVHYLNGGCAETKKATK